MYNVSKVKRLDSKIDSSVNWIGPYNKGSLETRYVHKTGKDYFIGYVSSHSGCKMGCKFCYLTQQKQTTFDHVSPADYGAQIKLVMDHYNSLVKEGSQPLTRININFMARGEPLANKYIINEWQSVRNEIMKCIPNHDLKVKFNISTIMPYTVRDYKLSEVFSGDSEPPHIYYSLYSVDNTFRREWLPNALPLYDALDKLKHYEEDCKTLNPIVFHWALIEGQNDSIENATAIAKVLRWYKFKGKFNLVRYNAHPNTNTKESGRYEEIFGIVSSAFENNETSVNKSYIVPRVGQDVSASCGMFIDDHE